MSSFGDFFGGLINTGVDAVVAINAQQAQLQLAQTNLAAEAAASNAATAVADANSANVNLLITGGLILAAGVVAIRALSKR